MPSVGSGSLFEIKDIQSRGTDQFLNVYWYYIDIPPGTLAASAVATAWETIFSVWLPPVQPSTVLHDVIAVDEVTSGSNWIERPSVVPNGSLLGTPLASFVSASIKLLRATKDTRNGWKRIPAGDEDTASGNDWTAGMIANLDNLAAVMNDYLDLGANRPDPVIVRKTYNETTGELNPPTMWIYNLVASAEAKTQMTTQNTRKRGRGA